MPKQILIADYSESIREILTFSLENSGYEVLVAKDGLEALGFFDGRTIDLLLTDYHMPNLNGQELIVKVRQKENYKFMPILVLTTEKLLQTLRKVIR